MVIRHRIHHALTGSIHGSLSHFPSPQSQTNRLASGCRRLIRESGLLGRSQPFGASWLLLKPFCQA